MLGLGSEARDRLSFRQMGLPLCSFNGAAWRQSGDHCGYLAAMTKIIKCFLVAIMATVAFAQAEEAGLRKEIQAVYAKFDKLVAARDSRGLMAMLDPSFIGTDADGKSIRYAETKQMVTTMLKSMRDPRSTITVQQVQRQGDEVVAYVTMKWSCKMKRGNKWVTESNTEKYAETLKKVNGTWRFFSSQALPAG
jgi:ketosteroid isomerase-like protein